jgi:hypothetical protein
MRRTRGIAVTAALLAALTLSACGEDDDDDDDDDDDGMAPIGMMLER